MTTNDTKRDGAQPSDPSPDARLPRSLCTGPLDLALATFEAHVLDDERRVLATRDVKEALAGGGPKNSHFGHFLTKIVNGLDALNVGPRIRFRGRGGIQYGYPAEILPRICAAITDRVIAGTLHPKQAHIGVRARALEKALLDVAIISLVDEATGYERARAPGALARKFAEYLLADPGAWAAVFPAAFYAELARLYRIRLTSERGRPRLFAWFTRRFIYDAIDPDVARELKVRNPDPHRQSNHHQHLTPRARAVLIAHLARVTTVMRQSAHGRDFKMRFDHEFRGTGLQLGFGGAA